MGQYGLISFLRSRSFGFSLLVHSEDSVALVKTAVPLEYCFVVLAVVWRYSKKFNLFGYSEAEKLVAHP
jgi:hypothetical protein